MASSGARSRTWNLFPARMKPISTPRWAWTTSNRKCARIWERLKPPSITLCRYWCRRVTSAVSSRCIQPPPMARLPYVTCLNRVIPRVAIVWHATGSLPLRREGHTLDVDAVIDAAAAHGVCIEVNADPARLDLDWRYLHRARDKGIKIPIDPDAHTITGLDNMHYGVGIARKGWLRASDVLNTMQTEEILDFFRSRRKQ